MYVVVADTGKNYYRHNDEMKKLSRINNKPIDSMGRYYNKAKNLIALPDTSSDEIYAGEYYPRRYASESLSLEYLNIYKDDSAEKTIALITGIYEKKSSADSALRSLTAVKGKAFTLAAPIYMGCMH
jgi:hypothetical protein